MNRFEWSWFSRHSQNQYNGDRPLRQAGQISLCPINHLKKTLPGSGIMLKKKGKKCKTNTKRLITIFPDIHTFFLYVRFSVCFHVYIIHYHVKSARFFWGVQNGLTTSLFTPSWSLQKRYKIGQSEKYWFLQYKTMQQAKRSFTNLKAG